MDYADIVHPTGATPDCTRFEAQCGGYMERDLDQVVQAWMTAHQSECASCAALVRELEAVVAESQALPGISPSRDLWSGIEARLDTPVIPISASATHTRLAGAVSVRTFAIAATMLVAVTSGITWRVASRGNVTASPLPSPLASPLALPLALPAVVAATADSENAFGLPGASVEIVSASSSTTSSASASASTSPAPTSGFATRRVSRDAARDDRDDTDADVVYEREISALRRIVNERFVELDTVTVRELRRNLNIIDRAIGDSRQALARDPRSALLATQLDRVLETKLALLRRVALL